MPVPNSYPNGIGNGLLIREIPIHTAYPGQVFWLYNGAVAGFSRRAGSDGNKGTYNSPFATLAYAISQCVANRGDVILVRAGHAENIADATTTAASVAGVAVVGTGTGTLRPTFTFTTANTATIPVSAANVAFKNLIFVANFLGIAAPFTLSTAKGFACEDCLFQDTSTVLNFLNIVKTTGAANTCDGLTFSNNQVSNLGVTSNNTTILTANTIDRLTAKNNVLVWAIQNDKAILAIVTAGILTNAVITDNMGYRPNATTAGGSLINVGGTTSTGFVARNYVQTSGTTTDLICTANVGFGFFDNKITDALGASGFLIPVADS